MRAFKQGFTLIEVMIVVVIVAILATIAVSQYMQYIEKSRLAAVRSLLQNLALAELTAKADQSGGNGELISIDGSASSFSNLTKLGEYGFRPDPKVGFAALPFDGEEIGAYVLFAAYSLKGSPVFVYNFAPRTGVREFDPSAAYAALLPATMKVYTWTGENTPPH